MTRSTRLWFEIAAFAMTITGPLAIGALAMRVFLVRPDLPAEVAITPHRCSRQSLECLW
jgi:hypothetical protein